MAICLVTVLIFWGIFSYLKVWSKNPYYNPDSVVGLTLDEVEEMYGPGWDGDSFRSVRHGNWDRSYDIHKYIKGWSFSLGCWLLIRLDDESVVVEAAVYED